MTKPTKIVADSVRKPPAAGKGRPKGAKNKTTTKVKEMILAALDEAHPEGGIAYLKQQATANPAAFMTLVGKVLPLQVTGEDGGAIKTVTRIERSVVHPKD